MTCEIQENKACMCREKCLYPNETGVNFAIPESLETAAEQLQKLLIENSRLRKENTKMRHLLTQIKSVMR